MKYTFIVTAHAPLSENNLEEQITKKVEAYEEKNYVKEVSGEISISSCCTNDRLQSPVLLNNQFFR